MPKIISNLENLARRNQRILEPRIREWMDSVQRQVKHDLTSRYEKAAVTATKLTNWEIIEKKGKKIIKPAAFEIAAAAGNAAYKQLAIAGSFDVYNIQAVKAVDKFCSKLVRQVSKKTRDGINTYIKHGIKQGWSMSRVARELRPLVGLTGNQTQSILNYRKLLEVRKPDWTAAQVDKSVLRYTSKTHRMRMQTIARTETGRAQNIGYCQGLAEIGLEEAELRNGPNPCDECIDLNKTRYPIDEAGEIIPVHPRCTCAMLPVIDEKTITEISGRT